MMPNTVSQIAGTLRPFRQALATAICRKVRESRPQMPAPNGRVISLEHPYPKAEGEARNDLAGAQLKIPIANSLSDQFQIRVPACIYCLQKALRVPPICPKFGRKCSVHAIADTDFYRLNRNVERFPDLCIPHAESQGAIWIVSRSY
jgi:hypothetical protein